MEKIERGEEVGGGGGIRKEKEKRRVGGGEGKEQREEKLGKEWRDRRRVEGKSRIRSVL